jgi:APA family basic amino acid/polyamine antiporter
MEPNLAGKKSKFRDLFKIKPLDLILKDPDEAEHKLNRSLGAVQLTLFGVGAIIGAGIFTTVGTAAAGQAGVRLGAGPALMLSFVITAVACAFTAFCYAEFASMVPISGSAYTYSYATIGELIAWIIGWDLIIEYAVGNIAVAIGWASYFKTFLAGFGMHVPDWLSNNYRTASEEVLANAPHLFGKPIIFNLLAVSIVFLITVFLVWGIKESARFNAVMVVIKLIVLLLFVFVGFTWVKPENWTPFAPNGFAGISAGASIIFFAFIGFDAVSTVAEETENPQKNLPRGIIASLIICTVLYIAVAAVFTGMIPFSVLKTTPAAELAEPLTLALRYSNANSNFFIGLVAFGSVISTTAVLLVFQLGQPRIFLSMARDGLLPEIFSRVHPKFRTPHISTILTGLFVAIFAAVASIDEVVDLTNIGTLFAFILVCVGIIVLRIKEPDRPRPFRVPGGLIIPVLGIISCLYLIYYLPPTSWLRFAAWLNFGFVIYVAYGSVKSRLTGRQLASNPAEHDAKTAYSGAWLGIIGTLLLIFMRWLDLWLLAQQDTGRTGSVFAASLSVNSWLEHSVFMTVPLALNAFVLCPIVIKRALNARRGAPEAGNPAASLAIAVILAVLTLTYLALVFTHKG